MLIVCDNCGAEYEIDDEEDGLSSHPRRGLRFRCSACGHTFAIGDDATPSGTASLSDPGSVAEAPAEAPPMLLKQEGKVYQVEDVATLQRWIVERRVLREDMISIGGLKWEPVGSRRDLQVFFHLVDDVERSATSGVPVAGPPVDTGAEGVALQGAAPWETAGPASGSALPLSGQESLDAELEDDGVDAGLPIDDLPPESWHRDVADPLESQGDADSFFTEAGDAGLPVPAVPNLAASERTADPESAGSAADEEVDPTGGVVPVRIDDAQDSALSSLDPGAEERLDRYLDHPIGSDPYGDLDRPRPAGGRWMIAAALLIGVGMVGLYLNSQRSVPPGGPAERAVPAATHGEAGPSSAGVGGADAPPAAPDEPPAAAGQAAADKAAADKAAADKAAADKAAADKAAADKAAADKAAADKAAADKAAAEQAAAEQAAARRAAAAGDASDQTHAAPPPVANTDAADAPADGDASADAQPTSADAAQPAPTVAPSGSTAGLSTKQLVDLGWNSIDAGDYATGRSRFDSALARSPHDADARFGLGYAYEKLGNLPAAIRQYCKVTRFGYGDALVEAEGRLRALGQRCE